MSRILVPAILTTALVGATLIYVRSSSSSAAPPAPAATPRAHVQPRSLGGVGLRCAEVSTAADPGPSPAARATEAELYGLIIAAAPHTHDSASVIVEAVSIPMPKLGRPSDSQGWPAIAMGLAREGAHTCVPLTLGQLPAGTRLVPVEELPAAGPRDQPQFFGFSRAVVDSLRRDAVVFYERHCPACGIGEWVWFHRDRPGAPWRVAGRRWSWIN